MEQKITDCFVILSSFLAKTMQLYNSTNSQLYKFTTNHDLDRNSCPNKKYRIF